VRDGRLVDEAALSFALAGVDDLFEEIRVVHSVQGGGMKSRQLLGCADGASQGAKTEGL
jgi:hypothetical protein